MSWQPLAAFRNVGEVVDFLRDLEDDYRKRNDRRALFAAVYLTIVAHLRDSIAARAYEDPEWVGQLVGAFASRYRGALTYWDSGRVDGVAPCWRICFSAAQGGSLLAMQDLLLALNAHMTRDLPLALSDVGIGPDRELRRRDTMAVARTLAEVTDRIENITAEYAPGLRYLDFLLGRVDENVSGKIVLHTQSTSWEAAVALADVTNEDERHAVSAAIDARAEERAARIVRPFVGWWIIAPLFALVEGKAPPLGLGVARGVRQALIRRTIVGAALAPIIITAARLAGIDFTILESVLIFVVVALTPLAVLIALRRMGPLIPLTVNVASRWERFGAALAIGSLLSSPGPSAAALSAGWLVTVILLAWHAIRQTLADQTRRPENICLAVAYSYLAIGAMFFVASRAGATPFGLREPIVLLAAVHYAGAGWAALSTIALVAGWLHAVDSRLRWPTLALAIPGTISPTVIGFAMSRASLRLEIAAAVPMEAAYMLLALVMAFVIVPRITPRSAKTLIAVSSASLAGAIAIALLYTVTRMLGHPLLSIQAMVATHGVLQVLGFVFLGLIGWSLANEPKRITS